MEEEKNIDIQQEQAPFEEIEGCHRRKVAIDLIKANIFAVVIMCVVGIVLTALFFLIWHDRRPIRESTASLGPATPAEVGRASASAFFGNTSHPIAIATSPCAYVLTSWRASCRASWWV